MQEKQTEIGNNAPFPAKDVKSAQNTSISRSNTLQKTEFPLQTGKIASKEKYRNYFSILSFVIVDNLLYFSTQIPTFCHILNFMKTAVDWAFLQNVMFK